MNMKPVELQIAIPRTQEVSTLHQQMQHRMMADQTVLNEQAEKLTEALRKRNEKLQESTEGRIHDEEHKQQSKNDQPKGQKASDVSEEQDQSVPAEHPYKGKHIDFSV
ncbi:hypothetical protein SAMN06295960_0645 [Paenibacillus aquistagni]|uniref:Uncharacterized protein n=2 Tax=Paenibacillus aquistagni TaxID=1852522 RepID=A0A1X7IPA0_9BACL|nr:hypothetical protein SAMN06295960_0645 [Paenibacillus aquistagni]